jgi:DNA-binding NarL/FixJ family response regulator
VRVAIADDGALFRAGLELLLRQAGLDVTLSVGTADELLARLPDDHLPDAVILDIRMPPNYSDEGLAAAEYLKQRHPRLGVLVLSAYVETVYAIRLLTPGLPGVGYMLKDRVGNVEVLHDALRRVSAGEQVVDADVVSRLLAARRRDTELGALTAREREVLRHMAEGRSNAGIGQQMNLAAKTVETHVANVFGKLKLQTSGDDNRRVLAVLAWLRVNPGAAPPGGRAGSPTW